MKRKRAGSDRTGKQIGQRANRASASWQPLGERCGTGRKRPRRNERFRCGLFVQELQGSARPTSSRRKARSAAASNKGPAWAMQSARDIGRGGRGTMASTPSR